MVKVSIPIKTRVSVKEQNLDKIIEDAVSKFKKELVNGIKLGLLSSSVHEALSSKAIAILNNMQAAYWGGASSMIKQEDPTQFGLPTQQSKMRAEIYKNLQIAASSILDDGTIEFTPISDEFMGIGGDAGGSEGIPWMAYFLSGALDTDLVWISTDTFSKLMGDSGEGSGSLGRFGVGHMWHVNVTQGKKSFSNWLKSVGLKYDQLRHPQSGKGGQDWFADLIPDSGIVDLIHQFALKYANSKMR